MKAVLSTAIAVFVSFVLSPHAETQVAPELEPSLRILQTVSTPMPDFRRVTFYQTFPDLQGSLSRGTGHSDFVRGWFSQMEPTIPRFGKLDARLEQDVDVYGDTVREEAAKVLGATTNLKKLLTDLDRGTSGKVQDLLAEYNDQVKGARVARSEFEAATKRAEQAGFLVEATDADAQECNLLLERSKLEAEKAALLAKMQKGRAFLNAVDKALQAMAGGPQNVASYVTGEVTSLTREAAKTILLDTFYAGTRETLYEIGAKIEAIDTSLQDLKCRQQAAALKAAKANLEARMIQMLVAFGTILDHRANAWRAVDRLGTLQDPQTGRKVPFFANLQTYNSQVNLMGRTVFDSVNAYLELLGREPLSRGELVLDYVEEDIATVAREKQKRDPSGKWTAVANGTRDYLSAYSKWYRGEVRRGQTVLADLREGKHLDFVDRMMARATRELGGTVSYDDIIR